MKKHILIFLAFLAINCAYEECPREVNIINLSSSTIGEDLIFPAAERWNTNINREVFSYSQSEGNISIFIEPEGLTNPGTGLHVNGYIWITRQVNGTIDTCRIHVESGPEEGMINVIAHELGHCLDLDDEYNNPVEESNSIMSPGGTKIKNYHLEEINNCFN